MCLASAAQAKELDQFSDRPMQQRYYAGGYRHIEGAPGPQQIDATLDRQMNRLLERLERRLVEERPRDREQRDAIVEAVFLHPLLPALVTPYEEWVKKDAAVPLYRVRDKGIYGRAVDYSDARISWYIEPSPILQLAGVLMGIDKLGHFISQGFQYYRTFHGQDPSLSEGQRLDAVRVHGHRSELGSLGVATTGIYSFADLAANWQGMLFYLSLFEDVELQGVRHRAVFRRDDHGRWKLSRAFSWREWVTADWDEVANPSVVETRSFHDKLRDNLRYRPGDPAAPRPSICDIYRADPDAFMGRPYLLLPRTGYVRMDPPLPFEARALDVRLLCRQP